MESMRAPRSFSRYPEGFEPLHPVSALMAADLDAGIERTVCRARGKAGLGDGDKVCETRLVGPVLLVAEARRSGQLGGDSRKEGGMVKDDTGAGRERGVVLGNKESQQSLMKTRPSRTRVGESRRLDHMNWWPRSGISTKARL